MAPALSLAGPPRRYRSAAKISTAVLDRVLPAFHNLPEKLAEM